MNKGNKHMQMVRCKFFK